MSSMKLIELKRVGAGVLEDTLVQFEWDSQSHTMMDAPWNFELKVNTVREMPAGSERPVEQILSKEWPPFEMRGDWKDKWAGRGFALGTYISFAQMIGRGSLVRFQLGAHSMVGLLTNLKIRYMLDAEIGWSVMFSPHVNETVGEARRPPSVTPVAQPISSRVSDLSDSLDSLEQSSTLVASVPSGEEDLDNAVQQLDNINIAFVQVQTASANIATSDGQTPLVTSTDQTDATQNKLAAMASAFRGMMTAANTMTALSGALSSYTVIPYDDPVTMLTFEEWNRDTYVECTRMGSLARAGQTDMQSRMAQRPRAIYRTRLNDSLERISQRFYGTADAWRLIYDANNLNTIYVLPNTELIIPERAA